MDLPQAYFEVAGSLLRRPTTAKLRAYGVKSDNELRQRIGRVAAIDAQIERMLREAQQMVELAIHLVDEIRRIASAEQPPECAEFNDLLTILQRVPPEHALSADKQMPFAARTWALSAFNIVFGRLSAAVDTYWGKHVRPERQYHLRFILVLSIRRAIHSPVTLRWEGCLRNPKTNKWFCRLTIVGQRRVALRIPTPLNESTLEALRLTQHAQFYLHVSSLNSQLLALRKIGRPLWGFVQRSWQFENGANGPHIEGD